MPKALEEVLTSSKYPNYSSKFIIEQYFPSLSSEKESALNYLHQANNWQLTISVGGLVAAVVQTIFPNFISLIIACLVLVATCHMFTRAAKAYTNLMRYSTIERAILQWISSDCCEKERLSVSSIIFNYQVEWRAPLKMSAVCRKVFFELGFSFQIFACLGVIIYCIWMDKSQEYWYAVVVAFAFGLLELTIGLFRSPYFQNPLPSTSASRLR